MSRILGSVTSIALVSPPPEIMIFTVGDFADAASDIPRNISRKASGKTKSVFFMPTSSQHCDLLNSRRRAPLYYVKTHYSRTLRAVTYMGHCSLNPGHCLVSRLTGEVVLGTILSGLR